MRSFLKKFVVFIVIPFVGIMIFILVKRDDIPAPKLTWSYSLNEKLFAFDNYNCDYLCIGSSIALNNVNSEAVAEGLATDRYFNFASWGTRTVDLYPFLKVYLDKYHPKLIFLASNIMDFEPTEQDLEADQIRERILYPYAFITPSYYLIHFDLHYYYKYYKLNKLYKFTDTINQSMKFDRYGGVPLNTKQEIPAYDEYWNKKLDFSLIAEKNYQYLDSISKMLSEKGIKFVFVQAPLRGGLTDDEYWKEIDIHKDKVRRILNKYNQLFVDEADHKWPDSLFFDYAHFRRSGAKLFSRIFIDKINQYDQLTKMEAVERQDTIKSYQEIN